MRNFCLCECVICITKDSLLIQLVPSRPKDKSLCAWKVIRVNSVHVLTSFYRARDKVFIHLTLLLLVPFSYI